MLVMFVTPGYSKLFMTIPLGLPASVITTLQMSLRKGLLSLIEQLNTRESPNSLHWSSGNGSTNTGVAGRYRSEISRVLLSVKVLANWLDSVYQFYVQIQARRCYRVSFSHQLLICLSLEYLLLRDDDQTLKIVDF